MNVALSGFSEDKNFIDILQKNGYVITDVVSDDTQCVITKENIDYIQFKSAKIKHAIVKKIPMFTAEEFFKKYNIKVI
jgi:hypothetical protein